MNRLWIIIFIDWIDEERRKRLKDGTLRDHYDEGEIRREKSQRTERRGREKLRPGNVLQDKTWRDLNENQPIG